MDVERSYFSVSRIFNPWVRFMEYPLRKAEVRESASLGRKRLIISPPTDAGIPLLVRTNAGGETRLLCFSKRIEQIASGYCGRLRLDGLTTVVEPFFRIPARDGSISVVYANCLFDFCSVEDIDNIVREIWRVLDLSGVLFAVYMAPPTNRAGRIWARIFERFRFLSSGCHPVSITGNLTRTGFSIRKDESIARFGFPISYVVSTKGI